MTIILWQSVVYMYIGYSSEKTTPLLNIWRREFLVLVSTLQPFWRKTILYCSNLQATNIFDVLNKSDFIRSGSRTQKTSNTEFSLKTVKGLKLQTIIKKNSISDTAEVLDTPLLIFYFADFWYRYAFRSEIKLNRKNA